jgi:hypothetical protein
LKIPTVAVVMCALVAGCASHAAPPASLQAPARVEPAAAPPAADTPIAWSATRPLIWDDFKAEAPEGGVEGAHTVYLLSYESRCRGDAFQFFVAAVFLPYQSWVKTSVLRDEKESARVLQHERTHFDITEVHARRMRKYFSELYNPCRQTEEYIRGFIDRYVQDEAILQKRYDSETRYGLSPEYQRIWDHNVKTMLDGLANFAEK